MAPAHPMALRCCQLLIVGKVATKDLISLITKHVVGVRGQIDKVFDSAPASISPLTLF